VFYVTVGTGVGGGFVIDGRLYGGDRPAAAEIGHLRPGLDRTDPHATVESIASGRGIETAARRRIVGTPSDEDAAELLSLCAGDARELTARHVAAAARDGNAIALDVWRQATRALGWAVAQAVTLLAPERVVIGGGVSLAGEELFFEPLRRSVAGYVFPPLADAFEILPAALGEEVVVHGALALAADAL
jgi:glucokinase